MNKSLNPQKKTYLAVTGELWDIFWVDFGGNQLRYISTVQYFKII